MIQRLLIVNRGEIARRIIRTAQNMGIETVAVYESEDANSPYVREANTAVLLPNGFLDQESILKICKEHSVDAIHPGYGFLSENSHFVRKVEEAKIIFIGPSADAMDRMGDKTAARLEAKAAKVPVLTGNEIEDASKLSATERRGIVLNVGLPVVLKAAAGGGGKAQAIINEESEITAAFDKVLREADRLYKSQALVIERYLVKARHVEVQILGNAAKKNYAIFDRDCSAQRNNQKIIEEAPAPNLPDKVRKELHASAVRLANHVGYSNAGTMEYLYDSTRDEFYFLEMNTRLQVEHTVTEMVTGLDLVYEQIRIAEGRTTDYSSLEIKGHAIEARICAEKSDGTYQPSTGTISQYVEPMATHGHNFETASQRVRVDSGVENASSVSGKYDNMIAKLIVHAENRDAARALLSNKLDEFIINGFHTNIPLLKALIIDPKFVEAQHYTRYLQREFTAPQNDIEKAATLAAIILYAKEQGVNKARFGLLSSFSNSRV